MQITESTGQTAGSFLSDLRLNRLGHAVRRGSWLLGALEVCKTLSTTLCHAMFVHDLEQELWWRAAAEPFCEIILESAKNNRGFGGGTRGRGEGEAAIHCRGLIAEMQHDQLHRIDCGRRVLFIYSRVSQWRCDAQ